MIKWNPQVKLILSDVDETIADLYTEAESKMIDELRQLLDDNIVMFFITGQSHKSVLWRITDLLPHYLRKNILIGHCSGAEVWGFDDDGNVNSLPYYSVYESQFNTLQKKKWREIVQRIIADFHLKIYPTMPIREFNKHVGDNPRAVMFEDRGPQITLEFVNAYDLRIPVLETATRILEKEKLPVAPRLAGVFALDFVVAGVSKTTAVKHILDDYRVLASVGLKKEVVENSKVIEIWGDKFSVTRGGTDRHMSEAVSPRVRSISFRQENTEEFLPGYNIVVWNGKQHLHHGLLEYLKERNR